MKKVILIFSLFVCYTLYAQEYQVEQSSENLVKFISDAPIEDFEGITNEIDGYLYTEKPDFSGETELYFEVDLLSLDTGIGLRNRHMRENYFETDKYPKASFGGYIKSVEKIGDDKYNVVVSGKLKIHGVEKDREITGVIQKDKKSLFVHTDFIVLLSDHKIDIPGVMFYKIDEDMQLVLDFKLKKVEEENK